MLAVAVALSSTIFRPCCMGIEPGLSCTQSASIERQAGELAAWGVFYRRLQRGRARVAVQSLVYIRQPPTCILRFQKPAQRAVAVRRTAEPTTRIDRDPDAELSAANQSPVVPSAVDKWSIESGSVCRRRLSSSSGRRHLERHEAEYDDRKNSAVGGRSKKNGAIESQTTRTVIRSHFRRYIRLTE